MAFTPITKSCEPVAVEPPRITLPSAETYRFLFPLSSEAVEAAPNERIPVPSALAVKVAPVTCWVKGAPLLMLAACPVTLKFASVPEEAVVRLKMALRALIVAPPGNPRLTAQ